MKRIAYILAQFPSLTETFIYREVEELQRKGCRLSIFSVRKNRGKGLERCSRRFSGITFYRPSIFSARMISAQIHFLFRSPARYISALLFVLSRNMSDLGVLVKTARNFPCAVYFAWKMKEMGIEHIHAHFAYIPTSMAIVAAGMLNIDFSFTAHAWDIYVNDTMLLEKMNLAKFVVTCNEYNRRYLEEYSGGRFNEKIYMVYHGVDVDEFRRKAFGPEVGMEASGAREGGQVLSNILSVGRLEEKKGFEYLIEACGILKARGHGLSCTIVGEGKQRGELERLIDRCGLRGEVLLAGELSQEELFPLYAEADIFVLPCIIGEDGDRDGLPNVLIEALALEIPSVSTDISAIPELIEDGETGLLVAEKDAGALALAVDRLILSEDLREDLAANGRKRVVKMFDIKKNAGRLLELMNED